MPSPAPPTIRDRFGSSSDSSLSPSPFTATLNRRTNSPALRRNSAVCRALGLTTSVRLSGAVYAWCTAFAAVTVDFPHCRVQFIATRRLRVASTRVCAASGWNPNFCLTHSSAPTPWAMSAGSPVRLPRRAGLVFSVQYILIPLCPATPENRTEIPELWVPIPTHFI